MKRFVLTLRAKQDISEIWDYISHDSIEAADRVLDALENAMVTLAKSPGVGHWREELTDKRHRLFRVHSSIDTKLIRSNLSVFSMQRVMCRASWALRRTRLSQPADSFNSKHWFGHSSRKRSGFS